MRTLILLVLIPLAAAACGESEPDGARTGWPQPDGDWQLVAGVDVVAEFPITMSIDGEEVTGRAACNSYFANVEVNGSAVSVGQIGQTEMACETPVMAAEAAFLTALTAVTHFRYDNNSLVLESPAGELVFDPVAPVPTADIIGTVWVLDTLIEGDTASTVAGEPANLRLAADGTLQASTGCRTLTGRWLESGGSIVVPELTADGECPEELAGQDSLVITVIGDEFQAEVEGNRLTLSSMGGDGLVFRTDR